MTTVFQTRMNIGTKMIGEMNITDIFRDCDLIKRVVTKCLSNAKASDVKGYFGINFEIELCKEFNSNNNDYKLLTVKAVGELINGFQFSFQPFCNDFQDLLNKTNSTFDSMSKTDLLLFKKESDEFRLIDWSSCKTCNQESSDRIKLHNDPEGKIHDLLNEGKISLVNIGKVHMIFYDYSGFSCFRFDGDFSNLFSQIDFDSSKVEEHTCKYKFYGVLCKRQQMVTHNRRLHKSGSKDTSFTRGIDLDIDVVMQSLLFHNVSNEVIEKGEINKAFIEGLNL